MQSKNEKITCFQNIESGKNLVSSSVGLGVFIWPSNAPKITATDLWT